MALGTHRIKHDDGEDDVWVTDGKIAIEITRELVPQKRLHTWDRHAALGKLRLEESIGGDPEKWEQARPRRYPADGYMTIFENWRQPPTGQIEFTTRRLPTAD